MSNNNCPKCGAEGYKEKIKAKYRELALEFLDLTVSRGYQFSSNNEFYVTRDFRVGIKIGQYTHSCHVDTTDFIVLFMSKEFEKNDFTIQKFDEYQVERINFNE